MRQPILLFEGHKTTSEPDAHKGAQNNCQGDFLKHDNNYDIREDERKRSLMVQWFTMEIGLDKQLTIKTKAGAMWINPEQDILNKSTDAVKVAVYTKGDFGNGDIESKTMIIRGPGEYDVSGYHLQGWRVGADETIYMIEVEDLKIALIPTLSEKWDKKKQERLGEADVLVVNGEHVSAKTSKELLKNTGTNYLIVWPTQEAKVSQEYVDEFDLGAEAKTKSVKIDKQNLSESLEVLILNDQ